MLAGDLVARKVAVINAGGGGGAVLAAKAATTTVPIVSLTGGDPIQEGFVGSLNRPGGNLTGISWFGTMVAAKALGLLHELVPDAALVGLMVNPNLPEAARTQNDAREAARTLGSGTPRHASEHHGRYHAAFASLRQRRAGALLVGGDPFFTAGVNRSSRWRYGTPSQRCIPTANTRQKAG